jgi:hypothetical protein
MAIKLSPGQALDYGLYVLVSLDGADAADALFAKGKGKTLDEIEQMLMRDPV